MTPRALGAAAVLALLLLRPALVQRHRAELPAAGSFTVLVPFYERYHDETQFAARVKQALLYGAPYNPYWTEDRRLASTLHDALSVYAVAAVALLCGGDLHLAWIATVALAGVLWFLLLHAALKAWSGKDEAAVPLALLFVVFPDSWFWLLDLNLSPSVMAERWRTVFFQTGGLLLPYFRRLPAVYLSFLALAGLGCLAWRLAALPRFRPGRAALLGLAFGLMTLVHPFESLFGVGLLWTFAVLAPRSAKANLFAAAAAALVVPVLWTVFAIGGLDPVVRADTMTMNGLLRTRRPYPITVVHFLAAAAFWALERREKDAKRRLAWRMLVSAQLAAFAFRNSQVLTGVTLQPSHFIPLAGLFGGAGLWLALSRMKLWTRRAALASSAVILAWGAANEAAAARASFKLLGLPADSEAALAWVDGALPKGAGILSLSMAANEELAVYTRARPSIPPAAPPASGFWSKDEYLAKVAELLKGSGADVERFLAERWVDPEPRFAAWAELRRGILQEQRVNHALYERAEWFYPWVYGDLTPETAEAGRRRLRELHASAAAPARPYWLWLDRRDERLLKTPPEKRGGRVAYENPSVRVFAFD